MWSYTNRMAAELQAASPHSAWPYPVALVNMSLR